MYRYYSTAGPVKTHTKKSIRKYFMFFTPTKRFIDYILIWIHNPIVLNIGHKNRHQFFTNFNKDNKTRSDFWGTGPGFESGISHNYPNALQDHCDNVENLRVERETYPWGKKLYKKIRKSNKYLNQLVLSKFFSTFFDESSCIQYSRCTLGKSEEIQNFRSIPSSITKI